MNSNSSYRAAPVFVRYIAILAGVVNFLPHPNPPRTRSLGSKKFTNDARIAIDILYSFYDVFMISEPLTLSTSNPVLAAKGLTRRFGGLIAVNDVSFTVQKHEIFGLIGPNGAGKTTLFNVMTGLIPASSGNLIYQNENISKLRPYQIAKKV